MRSLTQTPRGASNKVLPPSALETKFSAEKKRKSHSQEVWPQITLLIITLHMKASSIEWGIAELAWELLVSGLYDGHQHPDLNKIWGLQISMSCDFTFTEQNFILFF